MAKEPLSDSPGTAAVLRQVLAERENAQALGLTTRVEACDKQLRTLGYTPEKSKGKPEAESRSEPPKGRSSGRKSTAGG